MQPCTFYALFSAASNGASAAFVSPGSLDKMMCSLMMTWPLLWVTIDPTDCLQDALKRLTLTHKNRRLCIITANYSHSCMQVDFYKHIIQMILHAHMWTVLTLLQPETQTDNIHQPSVCSSSSDLELGIDIKHWATAEQAHVVTTMFKDTAWQTRA